MKRNLKKVGNKKRRAFFKQDLIENPEDAHFCEFDYKNCSTKPLNGYDRLTQAL